MKNQTKLIVLRGLPACGKTTETNKYLQVNYEGKLKRVRINRSTLRNMLWPNYQWSKEYENLVREVEFNMASELLHCGFDVIIDSTNLPDRAIRRWSKLAGKRFAFITIDFRNVPLETCLMRNMQREVNRCEIDVIIKLARENGLLK